MPSATSTTMSTAPSILPKYPPNSKIRSSNPRDRVATLRSEPQGLEAADPMTIGDMFLNTIERFPNRTAICLKENGTVSSDWKKISFAEYYSYTLQAAKSLLKVWLWVSLTRQHLLRKKCKARD
jgi:hypothetical protein